MYQKAIGSAGGGGAKSGSGTFTASSQEVPIPTGLSSVTRFVIFAEPTGFPYSLCTAIYDSTWQSGRYGCYSSNSSNVYGTTSMIYWGTAANERTITIKTVSDGTVTVVAPSNSNFIGDYYWYAE